jgi:hypothetical protein
MSHAVPSYRAGKRQYVELFGPALVMNTHLKIALCASLWVALGLLALNFRTQAKYEHLKPLIVRIDDGGRAQAVRHDERTPTSAHRPGSEAQGIEETGLKSSLRMLVRQDVVSKIFKINDRLFSVRQQHRAG